MKKHLLIIILFMSVVGFSQSANSLQSVNDYKYAIVSSKFDFLSEKDMYKMNTYTKMHLEKYGFSVYFDTDILPEAVASNPCNKVFVNVLEDNNMLSRKLTVVLKDCRNNVLFTSNVGQSKEKEYKIAYPQALRQAFNSFSNLNYKYNGKSEIGKQPTEEKVVLVESFENNPPTDNPIETAGVDAPMLNAQPILNGFQLVDNTPKVVLKIHKTSRPDVFIAENDSAKGILVKYSGQWFFEYYESNKLRSKPMNIKF